MDGDTAFKLYAGFDLRGLPIPHAAFEVSYIDFGQARVNFTSLVATASNSGRALLTAGVMATLFIIWINTVN